MSGKGDASASIELPADYTKLQIVDAGPLDLDGSIKASEAYRI